MRRSCADHEAFVALLDERHPPGVAWAAFARLADL